MVASLALWAGLRFNTLTLIGCLHLVLARSTGFAFLPSARAAQPSVVLPFATKSWTAGRLAPSGRVWLPVFLPPIRPNTNRLGISVLSGK